MPERLTTEWMDCYPAKRHDSGDDAFLSLPSIVSEQRKEDIEFRGTCETKNRKAFYDMLEGREKRVMSCEF